VALAAALALASALGPAPAVCADDPRQTVVIDPGHGGADLGARGAGNALEKELTLAVARKLAKLLRGQGTNVVLTRTSDVFVALPERTEIANRAHAALFVSIRELGAGREIAGSETYFLSLEASDDGYARGHDRERRVEARARRESADVVGAILGD
jgi:N-acetylmuramoyl-L-alanine amidase